MFARFLAVACLCAGIFALGQTPATQPAGIPSGLGVNIHFTDPRPGEMEMLAAAGFRWVRMDFDWGSTEPRKGEYDFSSYEKLVQELGKHHLRAIFILDYVNRLYDKTESPHTVDARQAYAAWAAAAAKHFAGRGILWEIYNEPNISPFWRPKANVSDYVEM